MVERSTARVDIDVVSKATQAPILRDNNMSKKYVLYVNVGSLSGSDVEKYLQDILNRFKE